MTLDRTEARYLNGTYLAHNPDWDQGDSAWKAQLVLRMLASAQSVPSRICEVGCGAGGILANLRKALPDVYLAGFDISPDAAKFWQALEGAGIAFTCADFLESDDERYDCVLLLDVIEHLPNPFAFLEAIRDRSQYFVFHFPLDLSAVGVLRETPILNQRRTVGHLHYFTKELALELLRESGFKVLEWRYTNASLTGPRKGLKTRLASLPRRFAYALNKDVGVRLLGGETLIVLASAGS